MVKAVKLFIFFCFSCQNVYCSDSAVIPAISDFLTQKSVYNFIKMFILPEAF